jgi:hypothetical protein
MALGWVFIRKREVDAYYPPIIKIPNMRYTPWRDRRRMRNPYSNDEVDSVAGQIYLFLSHLPTPTRITHIIIRFVSLFASKSPHYDMIAKDYLEIGAVFSWAYIYFTMSRYTFAFWPRPLG